MCNREVEIIISCLLIDEEEKQVHAPIQPLEDPF
jgi:hypothetical protein